MQVPRTIFREYDVRGLVDTQLTPEFAEHLGRAFATVAIERVGRPAQLAVGRDGAAVRHRVHRGHRGGRG